MTAGTLDNTNGTADIMTNGNVTGTAGIIGLTGDLFTQRVTTGKNFGATTANWTFGSLTFSNGNAGATPVTITNNAGSGNYTVGSILKIGNSGDAAGATTTLDAGLLRVWNLTGTGGIPFQILASPAAVFSASTSAFFYEGDNPSGNTTVEAATYYKLVIQNPTETFVPNGDLTATLRINVNSGTFAVGGNNVTIGSASVTDSGFLNNITAAGVYTQTSPGTTTILNSSGSTVPQIGQAGGVII
jgi:hypothetical protein